MQSMLLRKMFVLLAATTSLLGGGNAQADFQTSTTPVDMRLYFPNAAADLKYRRPDGTLYMRRVTRPYNDPMYNYLPDKTGTHFSRESYIPVSYGSEDAPYSDSWSLRHGSVDDMSVTEVADSYAPPSPKAYSWINGPGQYYWGGSGLYGIPHGKPGGHLLGENYYYIWNSPVYHTTSIQTVVPTLLAGTTVWGGIRLYGKYNTYAPGYGEIEEKVMFDERTCAGTDSIGNASEGYHSYIDDTTSPRN